MIKFFKKLFSLLAIAGIIAGIYHYFKKKTSSSEYLDGFDDFDDLDMDDYDESPSDDTSESDETSSPSEDTDDSTEVDTGATVKEILNDIPIRAAGTASSEIKIEK